ncbi:MAG: hypothetical protein KDB00_13165 [Planctomycetales bacterium]|nr:hypothetical protein [Planctomycetales bacterium]
MSFRSINRFLFILIAACLSVPLIGCGDKTETKGPEMGSIEAYLQEHPEEREDDPNDPGNETNEFAASE